MAERRVALNPIDAGDLTEAQIFNKLGLNTWGLQLFLESVHRRQLMAALPHGVSFVLASDDRRHQGMRVTITPYPGEEFVDLQGMGAVTESGDGTSRLNG